ncbi:hypothetical protein EV359DRAFT_68469, partial [Lentinula novae-zelandiae]
MGHLGLHEDLPEQMIADFVTSLPLGLHLPIAPSSGIHLEALMIFQKVEYWYGPRGIPTHADMVIPFTVFSENKGVGYVAFTGVSPFWFKRAETTPMFDIMQDSPDSFIMTWPLFRDNLTQEFHIVNTLSHTSLRRVPFELMIASTAAVRPLLKRSEGTIIIVPAVEAEATCWGDTQMPKQDTKISMYMVSKPAKRKFHDASVGAGGTANAMQQVTSMRPTIESPEGIELLAKLLAFNNDSSFGPCVGAPQLLRWERAHYMNLNPPKDFEEKYGINSNVRAYPEKLFIVIREFQDLMKATGLLVSGEAALDFFVHATTATELHALSKVLQCPIIGEWLLTHGYFFAPN